MFFSCDNLKKSLSQEKEIAKISLTEESFYDFRTIQRVRRDASKLEQEHSSLLFKRGEELLKIGDSTEAVYLIKKSIVIFPTAKGYYHLGSVLLKEKDYLPAEQALSIAERLNYPNLSKLYYKLSKAYAVQNNTEEANKYLKLAIEKGFTDIASITKDSDFRKLRKTEEYRGLIADEVSDVMARKEALFDVFISKFSNLELPLRIDRDAIEEFDYENYIPYDFEELLIDRIKKPGNKEYSFVGKVDSTDKYIAVVYSSIDAIEEDYPPAVENYLVVYDKKGNVIDYLLFSCNCSAKKILTGVFYPRKEIRVIEYENMWKYDPSTTEFMDNQIDNTVSKYISYYRLTKEGKIKFEKKEDAGIIARI